MENNQNIDEDVSEQAKTSLDSSNSIVSIIEFIRYFIENKKGFIRNLLLVGIAGAIILLLIPNKYKSTASFVSPPSDLVSTYSGNDMPMFSGDSPFALPKTNLLSDEPGEIYAIILKSREIKRNIISKFELNKKLKPFFSFGKFTVDDCVRVFNKMISIKNEKGIIYISIETEDPKLSAELANEYLNQFSHLIISMNTLNTKNERVFLGKRLIEIKNELKKASEKLTDFRINKGLVDVEKQSEAIIKSAADLRFQIIMAESELKALQTEYTEQSPKVMSTKAKIETLKKQLRLAEGNKNNFRNRGEDKSVTGLNLLDIPESEVSYAELSRETTILQQVYLLLTKKYELSKVSEAKENITLKIVDKANVPIKKSAPQRTVLLFIMLVVTFILTALYYYLKLRLDKITKLYPATSQSIEELKSSIQNELVFWKK